MHAVRLRRYRLSCQRRRRFAGRRRLRRSVLRWSFIWCAAGSGIWGPGPKRPKRREAQRRLCTNGPGRACDGLQTPQQYYACRPPTVSRRKLRDRASARQDYEAGSSRNCALLRPAAQFGSHGNGRVEWFAVTEFRPLPSVPLAANSSFGEIVFWPPILSTETARERAFAS